MDQRKMTEAQRAYEAKRAAKAGMSLDKWLANEGQGSRGRARGGGQGRRGRGAAEEARLPRPAAREGEGLTDRTPL